MLNVLGRAPAEMLSWPLGGAYSGVLRGMSERQTQNNKPTAKTPRPIPTIATTPGALTGIRCARLRQYEMRVTSDRPAHRPVLAEYRSGADEKECPIILARSNHRFQDSADVCAFPPPSDAPWSVAAAVRNWRFVRIESALNIDMAFSPDNGILIRISGGFTLILGGVISGRKGQELTQPTYRRGYGNARAKPSGSRQGLLDPARSGFSRSLRDLGGVGIGSRR